MKRYIYIIVGIIIIAAVAIAIIFYLKNPSSSLSLFGFGSGGSLPQTGTQGTTTAQGQNGAANGQSSTGTASTSSNTAPQGSLVQKFGIVMDSPVLDYFIDSQNNITAVKTDGTIISIPPSGSSSTLSSTTTDNIIAVSFSYDGKKVLISSGDPNNPQTNIFNVTTGTWTSLPRGMQSPQWSSSGYQVAYLAATSQNQMTLFTLDASNPKKAPVPLYSLKATDLSLQWVGNNQFALSDKPTTQNAGSIWLLDTQKQTLTPVLYETTGGETIWSRGVGTSTLGLLFDTGQSGNSPVLQLVTPSGATYHALSFMTLPSKCSFVSISSTTTPATTPSATSTTLKKAKAPVVTTIFTPYLYCGVPTNPSQFSSTQSPFPDAYNMFSTFTSDQIIRINLLTGTEDLLWNDPTQNIDVSDIKFFNNALFFINRYDQKLYGLMFVAGTQ